MSTVLEIAGIPIEITTVYENSLPVSAGMFISDKKPLFSVVTNENDIENEYRKALDECAYEGIDYPGYTAQELESTAVYRKIAAILPSYSGFVFHGAALAVNGEAFIFTAKSGTGKSTHANLWLKNIKGSYIVNGDKPVIRFIDEKPFVCGTPWMGKENAGRNDCVPLKAICFLSRGDENRLTGADFSQVMPKLLESAFRPADADMFIKTARLIEKLGQTVEFYELECNISDNAAITAFGGMQS